MAISSTSLCSANLFTPSQDETAPTNDINKTVKAAFKTVHTFLLLIAEAILLIKEWNGRAEAHIAPTNAVLISMLFVKFVFHTFNAVWYMSQSTVWEAYLSSNSDCGRLLTSYTDPSPPVLLWPDLPYLKFLWHFSHPTKGEMHSPKDLLMLASGSIYSQIGSSHSISLLV